MNRTVLFIGLFIAAAIVGVLFLNLSKDPQKIDSPLVGRIAPDFALKAVGSGEMLDLKTFRGKP
ncbi:MAG: DsbE family thiol:disulfide interchange protein, partial [Thermoanaerobaculia bacterium]